MKPLYRNLFLLFGVVAIVIMLLSFDVDYRMIGSRMGSALAYLPLVIGVWVAVYACNAWAFQMIVNASDHDKHLDFRHAYKLTVSGFAFSYTTPFGFGGGPYRVMELANHIGMNRAMSSVVLYSMMHILSHICLWATAAALFVVCCYDKMDTALWIAAGIFAAVLLFVIYFFYRGYKNGLIVRLYRLLFYIPYVRRYARRFYDKQVENMQQIDRRIACLHQMPHAFYGSLLMEYVGRLINSLEFYFILLAFGAPVTLLDALFVLAFSSLVGNLLFFFPMQMGAREGGLALVIQILGYPGGAGVGIFSAFLTRIRELVWIFIGVSLVKVGNKALMKTAADPADNTDPAQQ